MWIQPARCLCDENRFVAGFSRDLLIFESICLSSRASFFHLFLLLTLFISASTFLIVAINTRLISLKTKAFVDLYNERNVVERDKMKRRAYVVDKKF